MLTQIREMANATGGAGLVGRGIIVWPVILRAPGDEKEKGQGRQLGMQDCSTGKRFWK